MGTLVFAKDGSHADDIPRIVREEFGKDNDSCHKIAYRTTGKNTERQVTNKPQPDLFLPS